MISEYIAALRERDEPVTAADPDIVGPWRIWEREDMFHIFREWERFEAGHQPVASFKHREEALLFTAALRACARPMIFRVQNLGPIAPEGYRLERDGEFVGYLKTDRAELLAIARCLFLRQEGDRLRVGTAVDCQGATRDKAGRSGFRASGKMVKE